MACLSDFGAMNPSTCLGDREVGVFASCYSEAHVQAEATTTAAHRRVTHEQASLGTYREAQDTPETSHEFLAWIGA
eukprot:1717338-Amphidinium_carterae.1